MWSDIELTYVLIMAHFLIYIIAIWLTLYPEVTVFHLVTATQLIAFVIRPFLAAISGGYTLYLKNGDWSLYNWGLVYQLIFFIFYFIGYLMIKKFKKVNALNLNYSSDGEEKRISYRLFKAYLLSVFLGFFSAILMNLLSNGKWLPTMRNVTVTTAVPMGKVLFPMAVLPLTMSIPLSFILYKKNPRFLPLSLGGVLFSFLLLSLLYQRGFILMGLIVIVFFANRFLKKIGYLKVGMIVLLLIFLLSIIRPVANIISYSFFKNSKNEVSSVTQIISTEYLMERIKHFFLYSPNFDSIDVWPIAISSVEENGLLGGKTFLAIPARFLTTKMRQNLNLITAVDYLNSYYWGNKYWDTSFGFNVILPQELYLNFGWVSMIFGLIPGIITALIDRWLWQISKLNIIDIYLIGAAFFTGGFIGEIGGILQWFVAFLIIGIIIDYTSRIKFNLNYNTYKFNRKDEMN
ncbi:hypothetical protein SAMN04244560_01951 [Thermoanaerobacter thermohydrosulfuricus]|uniref:Oligosaccharide repeat unit polymerase n=1 Tax=Thermoanaerobacter thermohydrosulfuricus TaxID=1516 RepID=A0A1G7SBV6_THETY|nr:hypothetical protein SAMN04244560_01951 [Thermoanaerobacter thermohydrosulfuricus]